MYPLKQSTALDLSFFAHDANGDGVTGLTDGGFTKRVSKGGGAFSAMTVTITELENGWYALPLSSSHTDTVGVLSISLSHASCKRVNLQFRVHARVPDDLAYPATSGRSLAVESDGMVHADLREWLGTAPVALTAQRVEALVGAMGDGVVTAAAVATGAIDADAVATDAVTEIQAGLATATALSTHDTDVKARLPAALVSGRMDSSVGAMAAGVVTATAIATGAIDADAVATDAVTEIQAGLATTANVAAVEADTQDIQTRLPAALVGGRMDSSVGAMASDVLTAAAIAADALAEMTTDVLTGETLTELPQAKPPATPTLAEAVMLLYMAARNLIEVDTSEKRIANDAGTVIVKKPLSDSGTVYQEAEMVAGP